MKSEVKWPEGCGQHPLENIQMPRMLKRFLIGIAFLLAVIVMILALLAGPDQFRTVPEPVPCFAELIDKTVPADLDSRPAIPGAAIQESETKWKWNEPDVSGLSPEAKDAWNRCMAEWRDLFDQYVALPEKTKDLPDEEAIERLRAIEQSFYTISSAYLRSFGRRDERREIVDGMFRINQEFFMQAQLAIYRDHEDWFGAAGMCVNGTLYHEDRTRFWADLDWDSMTYYLRRGGLKGRMALAVWSVSRQWHFITKASEESPELHDSEH